MTRNVWALALCTVQVREPIQQYDVAAVNVVDYNLHSVQPVDRDSS